MRGRKSKVIVTTAFEFRMLGFAATFNRKESPPRAGAYEVPVETLDQLVETLDDVPTLSNVTLKVPRHGKKDWRDFCTSVLR